MLERLELKKKTGKVYRVCGLLSLFVMSVPSHHPRESFFVGMYQFIPSMHIAVKDMLATHFLLWDIGLFFRKPVLALRGDLFTR